MHRAIRAKVLIITVESLDPECSVPNTTITIYQVVNNRKKKVGMQCPASVLIFIYFCIRLIGVFCCPYTVSVYVNVKNNMPVKLSFQSP